MTTPQTHEILKNARAIMAERGMAKDVLRDSVGRVCLRGALLWGADLPHYMGTQRAVEVIRHCERAMGFPRYGDFTTAAQWNNLPDTTLEMVLERFDQAIEATAPKPETPEETPEAPERVLASV